MFFFFHAAAHCVAGAAIKRDNGTLIAVRLGEHNLLTDPDCDQDECADPVVNISIAETIVHESYTSQTKNDDIALIRLVHAMNFTNWMKPICLPVSEKLRTTNLETAQLVIAGFGKTETGSYSDVKLRLNVNGTSSEYCNAAYRKYRGYADDILPKQICAGGAMEKDSCNGDSGCPLMGEDLFDEFNPFNYLAGIVSSGSNTCGLKGTTKIKNRIVK